MTLPSPLALLTQPSPDDINERADQILSRPEFNRSESVLDRIGGWLNDFLGNLLTSFSQGGAPTFVAWLILSGLAVVAAWLLWRLEPWRRVKRHDDDSAGVATSIVQESARLDARQLRVEAQALSEQGQFDQALRARYRAVLVDLVTQGAIEDVAGRTPGEYRREVADGAPGVAIPFGELTTQFENVWYGPYSATADTLASFADHEQLVLAGVQP